jgi:hypothetical protein
VFLVVMAVYGLSPMTQNFDSYLAYPTAWEMVHHRTLYLDDLHQPNVTGHYSNIAVNGGHHVDIFPWADSLLLVPSVLIADAGHAVGVTPSSRAIISRTHVMDVIQEESASLVVALAAALVWLIAFGRLTGADRRRRRLATLIAFGFAFGTAAWSTASRTMWGHGPSLLALAVAVLLADRIAAGSGHGSGRQHWRAAGLGAALAAAYAFRPTNAIAVVGLTAWVLVRHRRLFVYEMLGAAAVAVPWLAVNAATFAALLPPYSSASRLGLGSDYGQALASDLISPSRGLLIYAPIVVLAGAGLLIGGPRWRRGLDLTMGACIVVHLLVIAALPGKGHDHWWMGHAYGSRLTTEVMVFAAVLSVAAVDRLAAAWRSPARSRRATFAVAASVVLLGWSVFANSQGALTRTTWCWNVDPVNVDTRPARVWVWSDPQFSVAVRRLNSTHNIRQAVFGHCQHRGIEGQYPATS